MIEFWLIEINRAPIGRQSVANLSRRWLEKFEQRGEKAHALQPSSNHEITLKGTRSDRIATSFRDLKASIAILAPNEGSINETVSLKRVMSIDSYFARENCWRRNVIYRWNACRDNTVEWFTMTAAFNVICVARISIFRTIRDRDRGVFFFFLLFFFFSRTTRTGQMKRALLNLLTLRRLYIYARCLARETVSMDLYSFLFRFR